MHQVKLHKGTFWTEISLLIGIVTGTKFWVGVKVLEYKHKWELIFAISFTQKLIGLSWHYIRISERNGCRNIGLQFGRRNEGKPNRRLYKNYILVCLNQCFMNVIIITADFFKVLTLWADEYVSNGGFGIYMGWSPFLLVNKVNATCMVGSCWYWRIVLVVV